MIESPLIQISGENEIGTTWKSMIFIYMLVKDLICDEKLFDMIVQHRLNTYVYNKNMYR